ncbi:RecX family transcriptional regulator [Crocinitomicaceae bacterium]|nr:RecX family transcriptional regulator [Crocinitomicaceae bacterium]MDC0257702.1 RecX family transcriptional regulator [Crocinitomicaceae bacterium]
MNSGRKYSLLEAKTKLEALCAYQERCSQELDRKMRTWGLDQEDRDALLADLITHNFLSEERFAEAFVSGKVNIKRWGKIKIRQHLKQKAISDYSIKKALEGIEDEVYFGNLRRLTEHKYGTLKGPDDYNKKVKLYRYLSGKGYETEYVREVVEEVVNS